MPYPRDPPLSKHDLCQCRRSKEDEEMPVLNSVQQIQEYLQQKQPPFTTTSKVASVYSYADAPKPPLSRQLLMVAWIQIREDGEEAAFDWNALPRACTLAVSAPPFATPHHEQNAQQFRDFLHAHAQYKYALIWPDKHGRWGILKTHSNGDMMEESYDPKAEYALQCHVISSWSEIVSSSSRTASQQHESTFPETNLWKPPTQEDDDIVITNSDTAMSTSLWEPPQQDFTIETSTPFMTTNNSVTTTSSTRKRRLEDETFHNDASAAAADAFYSQLNRQLSTRWQSQIYHMRNFNGWVKAMQIQQYYQSIGVTTRGIRILDLACGKGGDLTKWTLGKIANYVGMDVARGSLQDAAQRARKLRHQLPRCTLTCADLGANVPGRYKNKNRKTMESLLTWSLHKETSTQHTDPVFTWQKGGGIALDETFDVVSIQFAIHYMMSSQKRAKRFFRTVSQLLTKGGKLLVTTMDARVVVEHLLQTGCDFHTLASDDEPVIIRLGNGACRIQFAASVLQRLFASSNVTNDFDPNNWYGLEYSFTLLDGNSDDAQDDAVNLPEWLSPLPALQALAESVGLQMESVHNFHEFYEQNHTNNACQNSLYQMNVLNRRGSISKAEWEISRLYCAIQFVKVRDLPDYDDDDDVENDDGNDDEEEEKKLEKDNEDDIDNNISAIDPKIKAKLFPIALMKAKKGFEGDWNQLPSDVKTRLTNVELRKLAQSST